CPVCLGMPGVLPVLNKKVVDFGIKLGLATHCSIADRTIFARKNYFYPDLPKGYQITQYQEPLCRKGFLDIQVDGKTKRIGITRIHMEEDAGKNIHDEEKPLSYIDFNRSGVPLLEIVSEPDMTNTDEAVAYLKELRQMLVYLNICDGNMEEGSFRCDANISIKPKDAKQYGIRTELKNMNSFRNVQKALDFEILRHTKLVVSGKKVEQETRLWDAALNTTRSMRSKEESHDYHYFPDPDLLPLIIDKSWIEDIRSCLPELPEAKRCRFIKQYHLPAYDADLLTQTRELSDYFERCTTILDKPKEISNWIMTDVLRILKAGNITEIKVTPQMLTRLIILIEEGSISRNMAREVFDEMAETGKNPDDIINTRGLLQISDQDDLRGTIQQVLESHPKEVESYKQGKTQLLGFFVGQVMKATQGKANPKLTNTIIREILET
ncbi:MAG: Asp-tRNA(Asn)/Glu-tRNA(Gln) amidotransferase subunit GatB, partial [Deltaproteobacteria bacterium]|nr:Asp-tRNA(Asn)/Glu-tRNA(Gln) amidotransferase subunit GatB [Deltaproteobacteria bacterium]